MWTLEFHTWILYFIVMKRSVLILSFLAANSFSGIGQIGGYENFELVESIPVETTLDNPDIRNTRDVWLEMINAAGRSLDIEQFYISNQTGEPLEDILQAIIAAGKRGVRVRLIVDARMYRTYPDMVDSLGRQVHITKRIIDFGKLAGGVQHAKYFIVDGEEIFLGSQNFDWRALAHIHELGLKIRHHDAVAVYQKVFDLDWELAARNDASDLAKLLLSPKARIPFSAIAANHDTLIFTPTMSPAQLIPDSMLWDERNIVRLIDGAKNDVALQFLTYSPAGRDRTVYSVLNDALQRAAARGVSVNLIVSDWSKEKPTVDFLKDLSRIPNIKIKFSAIPEWSGGYIPYARVEHCKYIISDNDKFWLGTSNAEQGYFYRLRNVGVVVQNARLTHLLRKIFLKGWDGPYVEVVDPKLEYTPRRHGDK